MESADLPTFEWTDPDDLLNEATAKRPNTTQVDVLLSGETVDGDRVAALVEVKFTETGFGGCSHSQVAPPDLLATCLTTGPFGDNPVACWQLRNRDLGQPRRYDANLEIRPDPADTPAGCWFRYLDQPMRLAALARTLETHGCFDQVLVVLLAPPQATNVQRQWESAKQLLDQRMDELDPADVAAQLPAETQHYLTDIYGVRPAIQPEIEVQRWLREVLSWQLVAELTERTRTQRSSATQSAQPSEDDNLARPHPQRRSSYTSPPRQLTVRRPIRTTYMYTNGTP